jgi:hypothetical protein
MSTRLALALAHVELAGIPRHMVNLDSLAWHLKQAPEKSPEVIVRELRIEPRCQRCEKES